MSIWHTINVYGINNALLADGFEFQINECGLGKMRMGEMRGWLLLQYIYAPRRK